MIDVGSIKRMVSLPLHTYLHLLSHTAKADDSVKDSSVYARTKEHIRADSGSPPGLTCNEMEGHAQMLQNSLEIVTNL